MFSILTSVTVRSSLKLKLMGRSMCESPEDNLEMGLLMGFLAEDSAEFRHTSFALLFGMVNSLFGTPLMQNETREHDKYLVMEATHHFEGLMPTIPGKSKFRKGKNRTLYRPIFNLALHHLDEGDISRVH